MPDGEPARRRGVPGDPGREGPHAGGLEHRVGPLDQELGQRHDAVAGGETGDQVVGGPAAHRGGTGGGQREHHPGDARGHRGLPGAVGHGEQECRRPAERQSGPRVAAAGSEDEQHQAGQRPQPRQRDLDRDRDGVDRTCTTTDQVGHAAGAGLHGEHHEGRGQRRDEGRGSDDEPGQRQRGRGQEERGGDRGDRPAPPGHVEQHRARPERGREDGREPSAGRPRVRPRAAATEPRGDVRRCAGQHHREQDQHRARDVALQQPEVEVVGGEHQHHGPEHARRDGEQRRDADRLPPAPRVQDRVEHDRQAAHQRRHGEQADAEHQAAGLDGDQQQDSGHRDGQHGGREVRRRPSCQ